MTNRITTDLKEAINHLIASPFKNRIKLYDNIEYYYSNEGNTAECIMGHYKKEKVHLPIQRGFAYLTLLNQYELITIE